LELQVTIENRTLAQNVYLEIASFSISFSPHTDHTTFYLQINKYESDPVVLILLLFWILIGMFVPMFVYDTVLSK
jgi:hypothetical protein